MEPRPITFPCAITTTGSQSRSTMCNSCSTILIGVDHIGTTDADLADRAGLEHAPALVEDREVHAGPVADRARDPPTRGQWVGGHLVTRLGHAVGLEHWHTEAFFHLGHDGGRQRGAARPHEAEALRAGWARRLRPHQDHLMRRR